MVRRGLRAHPDASRPGSRSAYRTGCADIDNVPAACFFRKKDVRAASSAQAGMPFKLSIVDARPRAYCRRRWAFSLWDIRLVHRGVLHGRRINQRSPQGSRRLKRLPRQLRPCPSRPALLPAAGNRSHQVDMDQTAAAGVLITEPTSRAVITGLMFSMQASVKAALAAAWCRPNCFFGYRPVLSVDVHIDPNRRRSRPAASITAALSRHGPIRAALPSTTRIFFNTLPATGSTTNHLQLSVSSGAPSEIKQDHRTATL